MDEIVIGEGNQGSAFKNIRSLLQYATSIVKGENNCMRRAIYLFIDVFGKSSAISKVALYLGSDDCVSSVLNDIYDDVMNTPDDVAP